MLRLSIGGITPFSTIDYPNKLSAVFYFQGCLFRCPYCHNAEFQEVKKGEYPYDEFASFLEERKDFLDAVVFSGGEPLLFLNEVKAMSSFAKKRGYLTGLHTTGYNPERLNRLLKENLIDWVGIDLKSFEDGYPNACGVEENFFRQAKESIEILKRSGIDFEVRTTVYQELANQDSLKKLDRVYRELGVENAVLQVFCNEGKPVVTIKSFLETFAANLQTNFSIR